MSGGFGNISDEQLSMVIIGDDKSGPKVIQSICTPRAVKIKEKVVTSAKQCSGCEM